MQNERKVLFLSHVEPSKTGIGVEQRAWFHLLALSELARVVVVVAMTEQRMKMTNVQEPLDLPFAESCLVRIKEDLRHLRTALPGIRLLRELLHNSHKTIRLDEQALGRVINLTPIRKFDAIFCFRMRTLPIWHQLQRECGFNAERLIVDIDDIESTAQLRSIPKHLKQNGIEKSLTLYLDAWRTRQREHRVLSESDWSLVCSAADRDALLQRRRQAPIHIVPNTAPRNGWVSPRLPDTCFHVLLVGTMNYGPNADGALYFCEKILPLLKAACGKTVKVWIVGHHPPARVTEHHNGTDIFVTGGVDSLLPYYSNSDVAVVPIRHGGGTRIKILEAMALGRPVVSTTIGAEGIECNHGKDILIADSAQDFADCCLQLEKEPQLAARLTERAKLLIDEKYSMRARRACVEKLLT
jgi:polysaccharide biosynthesis protein PslH